MSSNNGNNSTLTLRYPPAQTNKEQAQPAQASEQNFNQAAPITTNANFNAPRLHTGNLLSRGNEVRKRHGEKNERGK